MERKKSSNRFRFYWFLKTCVTFQCVFHKFKFKLKRERKKSNKFDILNLEFKWSFAKSMEFAKNFKNLV